MSGSTTRHGILYPSNADALTAFPTLMKTAMETLDEANLRGVKGSPWAMSAGTGSVTVPSGSVSGNSAKILFATITGVSNRFSQTPIITVSPEGSTLYAIGLISADNLGFIVQARSIGGSTAGFTASFRWIAVQMLSTGGQG